MVNQIVKRLPVPFQVQSSVVAREIHCAGTYDINWNEKYAAKLFLRWRRKSDFNSTAWELHFGAEQDGIITFSSVIMEVDYAHLTITNVQTELENLGIFPECGITVTKKGVTILYALYPSLGQTLAQLQGSTRFDIACLTIGTDDWYEADNKDWQKVEDGNNNGTGMRWLSTPNFIDDERQPDKVRLYCATFDTLDADPKHMITLTRY